MLPTFKLLNNHGFEIRASHGREKKHYIKFDEDNLSLYLEVRLPGQLKWIKIKPEQARSFSDEKDRQDYQTIKRGLMRPNDQANPNMIPLGSRHQTNRSPGAPAPVPVLTETNGVEQRQPVAAQRSRWIPPPRSSTTNSHRSSTSST